MSEELGTSNGGRLSPQRDLRPPASIGGRGPGNQRMSAAEETRRGSPKWIIERFPSRLLPPHKMWLSFRQVAIREAETTAWRRGDVPVMGAAPCSILRCQSLAFGPAERDDSRAQAS